MKKVLLALATVLGVAFGGAALASGPATTTYEFAFVTDGVEVTVEAERSGEPTFTGAGRVLSYDSALGQSEVWTGIQVGETERAFAEYRLTHQVGAQAWLSGLAAVGYDFQAEGWDYGVEAGFGFAFDRDLSATALVGYQASDWGDSLTYAEFGGEYSVNNLVSVGLTYGFDVNDRNNDWLTLATTVRF